VGTCTSTKFALGRKCNEHNTMPTYASTYNALACWLCCAVPSQPTPVPSTGVLAEPVQATRDFKLKLPTINRPRRNSRIPG